MAFNKNKKIVTTALTAAMVASAVAPVAAAKLTPAQDATKAVDGYYKLSVKTRADVSNSAKVKKAALAKVAKLTSKKDAKLKASLTAKVAKKSAAINKYYNTVIVPAEVEAKNIATAKAALEAAKAYVVTADTKVEDVEKMFAEGIALINKIKTASVKADLTKQANDLKTVVLAKIDELAAPKVASVTAVNGKELEIKFNKAVKKDTVVDASGNLINASVTAIGSASVVTAPKASLSEDGKTLVVTATTNFNGEYAVTVSTAVKTTTDVALTAYSGIVKASDTARPTVAGVTYSDYQTAVITFSEPLSSLGTIAANNADITFGALSADGKSVTVNLASVNVKADTDYKVTIIGAKDFNQNLITPNPVEVTVKKSTSDTVKPTVSTLSVVNDKSFNVTFSEKLIGNPTIKVNGNTVVTGVPAAGQVQGTITKDSTGLVYNVTLTNSLVVAPATSALATIEASFSDLSGNVADAFSRIVEFKKDTTAPALLSSSVEKINGKEYLVLNYDENVTATNGKSVTGKVVKDFVESAATTITTDSETVATAAVNFELHNAVNGKSKSVRLDLATLSSGAYTLNLPVGLVADESSVDSAATTVTFNRNTNVDTGKPALTTAGVNGITKVNNNTYTVSFDRQLDPASALTLANYSIEGATVKSAIFTQNDSTGAVVRITLNENSVTLNGERTVTIQNVKSAAGVAMDTKVTTEFLTENVNPLVASTQLVGLNKIKVVFSENIDATTVGNTDFDVLIGDVAETGAVIAEDATDTSGKTFIITLADDITATEYAKTITLKAGSALSVTDENANALVFTTAAVTK